MRGSPLVLQLIPAVGIIAFAAWCLGPLMRLGRILFFNVWTRLSSVHALVLNGG